MPLPTTTGLTLLVLPLVVLADVERIARCVAISERACAKSLGVQLKEPLSKAVPRVATPLMPFVASAEGDAVFKQLIAVNKHWVPAAADAIEGYAGTCSWENTNSALHPCSLIDRSCRS